MVRVSVSDYEVFQVFRTAEIAYNVATQGLDLTMIQVAGRDIHRIVGIDKDPIPVRGRQRACCRPDGRRESGILDYCSKVTSGSIAESRIEISPRF